MSDRIGKPQFSREHRFGLVQYGGIALAIYMNGICQEFYNAVRGRGIYKLIKALTDADIVVDITSGTSAGGINGVLLSYALANSQKEKQIRFEEFAKVWVDSGDIRKLFFKEEDNDKKKASFFDGVGYFKPEIKKALKERVKDLEQEVKENDWFSEFGELDLFITGTDLLGRVYQVFDSTGHIIDVKDHRVVFHLKYREQGNNDFAPDKITCKALAKLCQITSSFPAAFPPVTVRLDIVTPKEQLDNEKLVDEKLVEWGSLRKNRLLPEKLEDKPIAVDKNIDDDPGKGYRLHFVDGGVLDNRPFSYTIKEIYHRTAERPVFRKLFYVDPTPDRFKDNSMLKPDIVQVVLDSLSRIPRYESIHNDLEQIKEHNEKVRRYKFLVADIENILDKETPDPENEDIYDQQRNVYLRTRLISLKDKILPLIFLESNDFLQANVKGTVRTQSLNQVAELLTKPFVNPQKKLHALNILQQFGKEVSNLDVEYALRRQFFIVQYIFGLLDRDNLYKWIRNKKDGSSNATCASKETLDELIKYLTLVIRDLNTQIKILEFARENLYNLFSSESIEKYFFNLLSETSSEEFPEKFYKLMLWIHARFFSIKSSSSFSIDKLEMKDLKQKLNDNAAQIKKLLESEDSKNELNEVLNQSSQETRKKLDEMSGDSIIKILSNQTNKFLEEPVNKNEYFTFLQKKLWKYFNEFDKFDVFLYPLDYLSGIPEKQLIETDRISPEDAHYGLSSQIEKGKRIDCKLTGDSLNAFGGFLKKSWRANDILWGRLDGLNRIVEALITEDKINNFPNFLRQQAQKEGISENVYLDRLLNEALSPLLEKQEDQLEDIEKSNRKFWQDQKEKLAEKINELIQVLKNEKIVEKSLHSCLQELVEALVNVGHYDILDQDLTNVLQVVIEEKFTEELQRQTSKSSKALKFNFRTGDFYPEITPLVVGEVAKKSLSSMSLKDKVNFFSKDYKIGLENLKNIPESEIKEITLRFNHIFQDIFKTWLAGQSAIRLNFVERLGFRLVSPYIVAKLKNIFSQLIMRQERNGRLTDR